MGYETKSVRESGDLTTNLRDLDETGRLQFFYHSPRSRLPVRDVLNGQGQGYKTEPHIEKNAENHCRKCVQRNVQGFLRSRERYLFLFTRSMNRQIKHSGRLSVVGYIVKEDYEFRPGRFYAVSGETRLFSFEDAYPLRSDANPRHMKKTLGRVETGRILDHFDGKRNILNICIAQVRELKRLLPKTERRKQARQCR